jgi:hypothetical protein
VSLLLVDVDAPGSAGLSIRKIGLGDRARIGERLPSALILVSFFWVVFFRASLNERRNAGGTSYLEFDNVTVPQVAASSPHVHGDWAPPAASAAALGSPLQSLPRDLRRRALGLGSPL